MTMMRPNAVPKDTKTVTRSKYVPTRTGTHTHTCWKMQKENFYKLKRYLTLQTHYFPAKNKIELSKNIQK